MLVDGGSPAPGFNSASMVFLLASDDADDAAEVTRETSLARPLSFKYSDSKLVAAVANRSVAALAEATPTD